MHDMKTFSAALSALTFAFLTGCTKESMEPTELETLNQKISRYAPVNLRADVQSLSAPEKQILRKLVEASRLMDSIFLDQTWSRNLETLVSLQRDSSDAGKLRLRLFEIEMGPWSSLDDQRPFITGVPDRPAGANHYPEDMTKEEFDSWKSSLSSAQQEAAVGYFSVIRRNDDGGLRVEPYRTAFAGWLRPAAQLLNEAADLAEDASLRKYLRSRAAGFLSDEYYESDLAWMDLDSRIEPTIGPYEVYMDELFNYKAAYESFIGIRNDAETEKLRMFGAHLQSIEDNLPIDPALRNPKLGSSSPIRVIDLVAVGGEARAGVQTAAFNLPNDERVIAKKGSKRVMLKNVQEAKFNNVLVPIAKLALPAADLPRVSFDQFFTHILAHELMHGLGPHNITVGGKSTTVRKELKELSSAMEEAKADIAGLFALQFLADRGVLPKEIEESLYTTFLASAFRSVRFGINEAHGKGMALQFNYLLDEGAFTFDSASVTFAVNSGAIAQAVSKLTGLIMTLQANGDYAASKELIDRYGVIRPPMRAVLEKMTAIPVDIAPKYEDLGN